MTGALVGNSIGANNVPLANRFYSVAFKSTVAVVAVMSTVIILFREKLARMLTDDEEVIEVVEPLLFIAGFIFLATGTQTFFTGVIRGLGLQKKASYIALLSHWVIGLPLAALFAFVLDFRVNGLLMGSFFAGVIQVISYFFLVLRANWQTIANESAERMMKEEEEIEAAKAEKIADSYLK